MVKTWRNGQRTKSPTSLSKPRNGVSAISSPPRSIAARVHAAFEAARWLRFGVAKFNPATKTRGEGMRRLWKSRERQGTGAGTGSGAGSAIRMRSRPATGTASVVCSRAALSPRMRRHDRFSLLALRTSAASAKASRRFRHPVGNVSATAAEASGPHCFDEQVGEEAATPGQPAAFNASGCFPPAIRSRRLPAATSSAAIIGKLRNSHVSLTQLSTSLLRRTM